MLTALLPGLREIRSAVAAGFLWMLAVWIALVDEVPPEGGASGVWDELFALRDALSPVGTGVAVTFAAYLIGSLSIPLFDPILTRMYRRLRLARFSRRHKQTVALARLQSEVRVMALGILSGAGSHSLASYVRQRVNEAVASGYWGGGFDDPVLQDQTYRNVIGEMRLIERRLIGQESELHADLDRLRAETELRTAIVPPLTGLALMLSALATPLWLLLLAPIAALFLQGQLRLRERNDSLVDTLLLERVEAPVLERMRMAAEQHRLAQEAAAAPPQS